MSNKVNFLSFSIQFSVSWAPVVCLLISVMVSLFYFISIMGNIVRDDDSRSSEQGLQYKRDTL